MDNQIDKVEEGDEEEVPFSHVRELRLYWNESKRSLRGIWRIVWNARTLPRKDEVRFNRMYLAHSFGFARVAAIAAAVVGSTITILRLMGESASLAVILQRPYTEFLLSLVCLPPIIFIVFRKWSRQYFPWVLSTIYFFYLLRTAWRIYEDPRPLDEVTTAIVLTYTFILIFFRLPFRFALILALLTYPLLSALLVEKYPDVYTSSISVLQMGVTVALSLYVNWRTEERERAIYSGEKSLKKQKDRVEVARVRAQDAEQAAGSQLAQLRSTVTELRATRNQALERVGHNLRQPLTIITNLIPTALIYAKRTDQKEMIQIIHGMDKANSELTQKFGKILHLRKLEEGDQPIELKKVNIRSLVELISESYRESATHKGLTWRVRLGTDGAAWCDTDEQYLSECIGNLVSNAIKYTPPRAAGSKSRAGVVLGLSCPTKTRWRIDVFDTGIGIPQEAQSQIWHAFEQAKNGERYREGGMGIGLALVNAMITNMPGHQIDFQSRLTRGSRFSIYVPASHGHDEPRSAPHPGHAWSRSIFRRCGRIPQREVRLRTRE